MKVMKKRFTAFEATAVSVAAIIVAVWLTVLGVFIAQAVSDKRINDSVEEFLTDFKAKAAVTVTGIKPVAQSVQCEYALIEMLSKWRGGSVTEESLLEKDGGGEMNANGFAEKLGIALAPIKVQVHKKQTNSRLLELVYSSLERGMPVPVRLACQNEAQNKKEWALQYALVTGMDVLQDKITVLNPYGYEKIYKIEDFMKATRFDSFEKMPLQIEFGLAFGIFEKNTIYILSE